MVYSDFTLALVNTEKVRSEFLIAPILGEILEKPNVTYDSLVTAQSLEDAFKSVSLYRGMVKAGDPIVTRDRLIDSTTYFKLVSYKTKYNSE